MNFSELESLMSSSGVTSLADIARTLNTTPQAVSNWKARNQVPHHVVAKLNQAQPANDGPKPSTDPQPYSLPPVFEDTISLSDILLSMSEQLKVILIMPLLLFFSLLLIFCLITRLFTNLQLKFYYLEIQPLPVV